MAASSERESTEKSVQTYAALSVGFVCIVIGFPLWWKTTQVYRVPLPYGEINTLASAQVKYQVQFTTIILEENISKTQLALFGEQLKDGLQNIAEDGQDLSPEYKGHVRLATSAELKTHKQAQNIEEFDRLLNVRELDVEHGKYQFIVLPKDGHITLAKPYIGRARTVYLDPSRELQDQLPLVTGILRSVLVNEAAISKAFHTARGMVLSKADKDSMRSLRLYPSYEVTFTLLNPQPEVVSAEWDIQGAIRDYMNPLLKAFAPYTTINVKSQYLHYAGLGVQPYRDDTTGEYKLNPDQLPRIINPIEGSLSSHVSTAPNLNFVLYVTPQSHSPLHIYDANGDASPSNSFLSPRWGGVLVYNYDLPDNASRPAHVEVDMRIVMETFLHQLRLLMGINPQVGQLDVDLAQPGRDIITDWELDMWLRLRAVENIATSASTLRSLAQLLEEISNIVINDDIGREVERSVSSINAALTFLRQAKLQDASVVARQALLSSETAFFDPSLLELLYFPEDQKFAIYIPLFLPIGIPVILSVIQAVKRIRNQHKVKTE